MHMYIHIIHVLELIRVTLQPDLAHMMSGVLHAPYVCKVGIGWGLNVLRM